MPYIWSSLMVSEVARSFLSLTMIGIVGEPFVWGRGYNFANKLHEE
jgi:hypothetical protein